MFHRFHRAGSRPSAQGSITDTDLERILQQVGLGRIRSPAEWLARVDDGRLAARDLCLTFDDGLRSQLEVALPVLDSYGIKAFWFVFSSVFEGGIDRNEVYSCFATTDFESFDAFAASFLERLDLPEQSFLASSYRDYSAAMRSMYPFYSDFDVKFRFVRNQLLSRVEFEGEMDRMIAESGKSTSQIAAGLWMGDDDLRHLHAEGHVIGLHSYSHPFVLADLAADEQEREYRENQRHLAAVTGSPVTSMSHPLNSYGPETLEILAALGVSCGFRSDRRERDKLRIDRLFNLQLPREDSANLVRAGG